ncbi:hypothetical protein HYR99_18860 [Candidatus Poribacteria bacterium]|nr:hypothetical protein [Candidatus Poribacteria bacterium]
MCRFHAVPLPTSANWHVDLFKRFCLPSDEILPGLFDESLASDLEPFRRFRHIVHHSYSFQLDWNRMQEGIASVEEVFLRFESRLFDYLQTLVCQ